MENKTKKPWIVHLIKLKFPRIVDDDIIMVWGDTVYKSKHIDFPNHLVAHEQVHIKQQKGSKLYGLIWLIGYIFSNTFRLNKELEAYRIQYRISGDPKVLHKIATDLSSDIYGNLVSFDEAVKLIKQ